MLSTSPSTSPEPASRSLALICNVPSSTIAKVGGTSGTVGASLTAATETSMVPMVVAMSVPSASVEVAVTVSWKSSSEFAGGVMVRPTNMPADRVQVPSRFGVPAESVAPAGTPEMVIDRDSEPSVSVSAEEMSNEIAVSSAPEAA